MVDLDSTHQTMKHYLSGFDCHNFNYIQHAFTLIPPSLTGSVIIFTITCKDTTITSVDSTIRYIDNTITSIYIAITRINNTITKTGTQSYV